MAVVALEQVPKKVKDLYSRARDAHKIKNYDFAIELALMAIELEPFFLEGRRLLRQAEIDKSLSGKKSAFNMGLGGGKIKGLLKKDPMKALAMAEEELMRKDPLNPKFIDTYVDVADKAKLLEAGLMTMELARPHVPDNLDFIEKLGTLYMKMEMPREAADVFQILSDKLPEDLRVNKLLRDAQAIRTIDHGNWEKDGDFTDKLQNADEARQLEQESKAVLSEEEVTEQIAKTLRLHQHQPENINYIKRLAELHTEIGDLQAAVDYYEKANDMTKGGDPEIEKELTNSYVMIYDHNISVYEEEGDEANAEEMRQEKRDYEFTVAADRVKKYPNDREYKFFYGALVFERGDYNEATRQFQEAKRNPK
jgi:tetratricopeptide (TPR) repeat protein